MNGVRAVLTNDGFQFFNRKDNRVRGYEVPAGSERHSIFQSVLWVAGLIDGEAAHFSSEHVVNGERSVAALGQSELNPSTVFRQSLEGGWYSEQWNAGSLSSGMYLLRLTLGGRVATNSVVVVK